MHILGSASSLGSPRTAHDQEFCPLSVTQVGKEEVLAVRNSLIAEIVILRVLNCLVSFLVEKSWKEPW